MCKFSSIKWIHHIEEIQLKDIFDSHEIAVDSQKGFISKKKSLNSQINVSYRYLDKWKLIRWHKISKIALNICSMQSSEND